MTESILNSILPDINSFHTTKHKTPNKDLFTQKLGHNITIDYKPAKKNYTIFINQKNIQQRKIIPKNKTNIQLSLSKEENLRKIWEPKSIFNITHKNRFWGIENNKQMMDLNLDTSMKNKRTKKEIKNLLDEKEKFQKLMPQLMIYNSFKSSKSVARNIRKENSKDSFDNKKISLNKKLSFQNLSILNKNNNNFGNVIERITREEKKSKIFIKSFYESIIDISISYDAFNKYISLVNKFNETYIFLFNIQSFPINPFNIKFLDNYKISCILIVPLIFLGKDKNLYIENVQKMKEFFQQYIYTSIKSLDYKSLESTKINDFISKMKSNKENANLIDILNQIINILFQEKKNEYKKLRKCLKQLINNIEKLTPNQVLLIVNDSILFCNNCDYYNPRTKKLKKIRQNIKDKLLTGEFIKTPFIKNKMIKKFCLVLDLDETLIHNLNLPFGDYFFVRPGLFELFEKVHNIFEIIIFTAGKKGYAHKIIDKIDFKNNVDYILNKKHISNIEGNMVKKLDLIGRDLNKIICVDNLEKNALYNKKNLYLISSWYNDIFDKELLILKDKLIKISTCGKFDEDITKGLINEEEHKTCEEK